MVVWEGCYLVSNLFSLLPLTTFYTKIWSLSPVNSNFLGICAGAYFIGQHNAKLFTTIILCLIRPTVFSLKFYFLACAIVKTTAEPCRNPTCKNVTKTQDVLLIVIQETKKYSHQRDKHTFIKYFSTHMTSLSCASGDKQDAEQKGAMFFIWRMCSGIILQWSAQSDRK